MELEQQLISKGGMVVVSKPSIFDFNQAGDQQAVSELFTQGQINTVVDDYEEQLQELFQVNNPTLVFDPTFKEQFKAYTAGLDASLPRFKQGRWVFFPWLASLVHILEETDFYHVRTARNRNLITTEEQDIFYRATVGIAGLSVGNSVALSIVLQGGAKHIKLADHDRLALSNINRVRAGVDGLGVLKVEVTARQIYQLNPYAEIELFPDGITLENIDQFFSGLNLVVDEIDNIAVKHLIRQWASKKGVPLVMGADNGDNAVVDVERYDQNPATPFFHGRIGNVGYEELKNLDKMGIGRTITQHIGPENVTERMQQSLLAIGKTIVSWPQLGGAALLNGSAVAYCVRKILTGEPLIDNRAIVSLDEKFVADYNSPEAIVKRQAVTDNFKKMFNL